MKYKNLIMFPGILAALIFLISSVVMGQSSPLDNAVAICGKIKKGIEADNYSVNPESRMRQWKKMVYESGSGLDKLLKEISEFRKDNSQGKMPAKNPFVSISEQKWRNFKLIVEYRRFLSQTEEELKDRQSEDLTAFKSDFRKRASEIEEKSRSGDYASINKVFDFSKSINQLVSGVQKEQKPDQIISIVNNEFNSTREAFLEYKTYTSDVENLYVQFVKIRKFCEGRIEAPTALNMEPPEEQVASGRPDAGNKPDGKTGGKKPTTNPAGKKTPAEATASGQGEFDFSFSTGYPYVGQVVYFKAICDNSKVDAKNLIWLINGIKAGKGTDFSYRFKKAGKYLLTLAVTEKTGKKIKLNRNLHVSAKDLVFSYGWKPESPSREQNIQLFIRELSGGIPPYDIRWKLDSQNAGSGKTGEAKMPDSATALLTVIVKDARGCLKIASTVITAQTSSLDYRFWWSNPSPIPGQPVKFTVVELKGGTPPYDIKWTVNGKQIGTGENIRYAFENTGEYLLEVEVSDSAGNKLAGEKKFIVKAKPVKINE